MRLGLGIYSVFRHPDVVLTRAIEVPHTPEVRFHHMVTVALDNLGEITHIVDDAGDAAKPGTPAIRASIQGSQDFPRTHPVYGVPACGARTLVIRLRIDDAPKPQLPQTLAPRR